MTDPLPDSSQPNKKIDEETGSPPTVSRMMRFVRQSWYRFNLADQLAISIVWFFVGGCWATAAPWLEPMPFPLSWQLDLCNLLLPWITVAMILWNATVSFRVFGRTGKAIYVLPLTIGQMLLFTLLFYQVYVHFGARHFISEEAPGMMDWVTFSLVHAFRAGDIADLMHAYGLRIQSIQHQTKLMGVFLLAYHLVVEFLFLSLMFQWLRPVFAWWSRNLDREQIPHAIRAALLFLVLSILCGGIFRGWSWWDLAMLLPDSILRVLDGPDALELFHLRIIHLPHAWLEGTVMAMTRVMIALWIARWLAGAYSKIGLRLFRGFGFSREELEEIVREAKNSDDVETAQARLSSLDQSDASWVEGFRGFRASPRQRVIVGVALMLAIPIFVGLRNWPTPTDRLAKIAVHPDHPGALRALATLERMGPSARSAGPLLHNSLLFHRIFSPEQTRGVIFALASSEGYGNPNEKKFQRFPDFESMWRSTKSYHDRVGKSKEQLPVPSLSEIWVDALKRNGPAGAILLYGMAYGRGIQVPAESPDIRKKAKDALASLGPEAAQVLIDHRLPANTSSADHHQVMQVISELDRYWFTRSSSNPAFNPRYRTTPKK